MRLLGEIGFHPATPTSAELPGIAGQLPRITLAALVLERAHPMGRDELAEVIWGDDLPAAWPSALRNTVSRVRAMLLRAGWPGDDPIKSAVGGYQLDLPPDVVVDVEEAERLVELAGDRLAAGDPSAAAAAARTARSVLATPFLAGVDNRWLDRQRDRFERALLRAVEREAEARLATGDHPGAAAAAEAAIRSAPLRETGYRLLMAAHEQAGNRAEALRAYERCRRTLAEELGSSPSPATADAYVQLLAPDASGTGTTRPETTPRRAGSATVLVSAIPEMASLWVEDGAQASATIAIHHGVLAAAIRAHGGEVFGRTSDAIAGVFPMPRDGLAAALEAQRSLAGGAGPDGADRASGIGLDVGEVHRLGGELVGPTVLRAGRVSASTPPGAIHVTAALLVGLRGRLPHGVQTDEVAAPDAGSDPVWRVLEAAPRRDVPV